MYHHHQFVCNSTLNKCLDQLNNHSNFKNIKNNRKRVEREKKKSLQK